MNTCKDCRKQITEPVPCEGRWETYSRHYCIPCWQSHGVYTVPYDDETETWLS